jgi:hypothetical protein
MARSKRTIADLLRASRSALKPVTEKQKLAHPELFSKGGSYFIPASVKRITAKTVFVTKSRWRDAQEGVSHSKAAILRRSGELGYKNAASEAQAAAIRQTASLKRAAKHASSVLRPGEKKRRKISGHARESYARLRRQKLAGKFIEDKGQWHGMIDVAQAVNDPMLNILLKS